MEIGKERGFLSRLIWKDAKPFTNKRDLNAGLLIKVGGVIVGLTVVILLFLPAPKPKEPMGFSAKADLPTQRLPELTAPETGAGMPRDNAARSAARGFDVLSGLSGSQPGAGGNRGGTRNLNSAMILSRQGSDSKTQLPPGSRFSVRLTEAVIAGGVSIPVIGELSADVLHDSDIAIPRGSKLLGEVAFDQENERARLAWKSVIFPDGRQRNLEALALGSDGQIGMGGNVHSEALKNAIGQTLTRFVGAYAEGTMTRNANGSSAGGAENGLLNALGQTAQDRADAWADGMKKERKWIELPAGAEALAVLSQPFTFKDPGSVH